MNEAGTMDLLAPTLRDIEAAVCARFGLTPEILRGPKKHRGIARPRQIVMFLAREMTMLSYPRIGAHFNRDHTTVLFGERRIRELMQKRPKLAAYVEECRALVKPKEKEQARELANQPLVTVHSPTNAQTILPLVRDGAQEGGGLSERKFPTKAQTILPLCVRKHAQGGGGFSERGACEGESLSSRAEAETGGG